ncbi:MAG: hypothetical protein KatS3mg031_2294 [Chitinophagales bacterium]|nr:MAG: hypothetical protein KatS3mg031_2294 [Chitinophagales bacterium]
MQRLGDFIASPYFNKDADLTKLFDYLLMLYPRYEPKATTRKAILQQVSAIKTENELLKKLTRLHELVRQFLVLELGLDEYEQRLRLLRAYKQLGMDSEAAALERQVRKELDAVAFRDETYWERLYHLEEVTMEGLNHRLQRNTANRLDAAMDALTRFYMTKKICYLNEAANRERLVGIPLDEAAKQEARRFLQAAGEDDPYLYIYAHLFHLNTERDPQKALDYYRKVKER